MQLKILSWNIWFDGYFDIITEFLTSANADVLCLQEVVPDDATRDVVGFLQKLGYFSIVAPVKKLKDGRTMSNAIFSKNKIVKSEQYNLSETENRVAVEADIAVGDEVLRIFTTHLLHTHQQPSEIQELQADNLIKILPKEKVLVMGDFNAAPDSEAIKKMNQVLIDTDPASTPTWSVYPKGCPVCKPKEINIRLDYIFTSKDIKVKSFEVLDSKGSDHLPITISIEI